MFLLRQFDVTVAEFWELDVESKLEAAEKWRLEGNSLFAKGSYREAGDQYHKAVSYLGYSKNDHFFNIMYSFCKNTIVS